ncbi:FCD domain-containing protein [Saliniramus sp.]|uniref:FCD domain-containing protein n=1 Tax=Saliniramus sp. TaxID=2986772 RepID=UPI002BEA1D07|nr:FCD domain-containing protein [Saliniramus sp.]HMB11109.1 FCD domain-containing protein [Saliniramus sp.]
MAEAGGETAHATNGGNNSSRAGAALRAPVQHIDRNGGQALRRPTERDLAAELGIGRRAVRRALLFGLYEIIEEVRRDKAWRGLRERARSKGMIATYVEQHAAIVDAIARHDPGAAEQAIRSHIATLRRSILSQDDQEAGLVG